MLSTVRMALDLVGPTWRRRWFWLVPLGVVTALLEMLGAGAVFVLIRLITDVDASVSIRWLEPLRWWLGAGATSESMTALVALLIAVLFLVKNGLRVLEVYWRGHCAEGSYIHLLSGLLRTYLQAPYAFHLRRNSAQLMRDLMHGAREVCAFTLGAATTVMAEAFITLGVIVMLIWVTPATSLAVAAGAGLLSVVLLWGTQATVAAWGASRRQSSARLLRVLQHAFGSIKEVKLLGRGDYFTRLGHEAQAEVARVEVSFRLLEWTPRLLVETLFICALAALVGVSIWNQTEPWQLAPTIGVFAYAALRLLPSFHMIVFQLSQIAGVSEPVAAIHADARRLRALDLGAAPASVDDIGPLRESLEVRGVSFRYEGAARPALNDVSFVVRRGESLGVVGSTGAGKSTLIDVLLGLLPPTEGAVLVDGRSIQGDLRGWQGQIGYVAQEPAMLDASIRENIAFGLAHGETDEARIRQVLRMAQLAPFVYDLEENVDTLIGERGVRISGGERQRIAIARALYNNPDVLVFDEATSSLDNQTERALTETVAALHGRKTMVIIAHRLSTVRHCDRLIFLQDGTLAGTGTYDELLQGNAAFREMAAADGSEASRRREK